MCRWNRAIWLTVVVLCCTVDCVYLMAVCYIEVDFTRSHFQQTGWNEISLDIGQLHWLVFLCAGSAEEVQWDQECRSTFSCYCQENQRVQVSASWAGSGSGHCCVHVCVHILHIFELCRSFMQSASCQAVLVRFNWFSGGVFFVWLIVCFSTCFKSVAKSCLYISINSKNKRGSTLFLWTLCFTLQ